MAKFMIFFRLQLLEIFFNLNAKGKTKTILKDIFKSFIVNFGTWFLSWLLGYPPANFVEGMASLIGQNYCILYNF